MNSDIIWPSLPYDEWKDTFEALHMKMQIIGKVKLELTPFLNQWWNVAFYFNASGITTGLIHYKDIMFEINIDFINHETITLTSDNRRTVTALYNCSVAEFYDSFMNSLKSLGINV